MSCRSYLFALQLLPSPWFDVFSGIQLVGQIMQRVIPHQNLLLCVSSSNVLALCTTAARAYIIHYSATHGASSCVRTL